MHNPVLNRHRVVPLWAIERPDVCWPLHGLIYPRCVAYPNGSLLGVQRIERKGYKILIYYSQYRRKCNKFKFSVIHRGSGRRYGNNKIPIVC